MEKKKALFITLLTGFISGLIGVFLLLLMYSDPIQKTLHTVPGADLALMALIIRISISFTMGGILLRKWFLQENQYLTDIPFLFGMFFLLHGFGKFFDIVNYFAYYELTQTELLTITKIRQFVAIATLAPMMYLSITMILFFLSLSKDTSRYTNSKERETYALKILLIVVVLETMAIILTPSFEILTILFPILVIPSLVVIVWIMFFSHKHKRLTQIRTLIVGIGFLLYLGSSAFRPIGLILIGDNSLYIILVETLEIFIFAIIFLGLILKTKL